MILEKRSVRLCERISTILEFIKSKKSANNSDRKNISPGCLHPYCH
jgi:hypothetical protein